MRLRSARAGLFAGLIVAVACSTVSNLNVSDMLATTDVAAALADRPAVTTSFADVKQEIVLPDSFGSRARFASLADQPHAADGSITLAPGFFELAVRSYCLHAGTSGPSHGDAYLYAPLKGPRAAVIEHVLQRSYSEQQVSQRDVQTLLWAIEAKAKPSTFATSTKAAAARLLSVEELGALESEALGVEEAGALERAAEQSAPLLRDAIMLDNQLRAKLTSASASYADLERLAVRPPQQSKTSSIPAGRWSRHPDGYYIRYLPKSYQTVTVQIYVPPAATEHRGSGDSPAIGAITLVGDVAEPANTGAQRLAVTNVPADPTTPVVIGPPRPNPKCTKPASDFGNLNYGVPNGTLEDPNHHPNASLDIWPNGPGANDRDEPVFLSVRPTIDMQFINGKGGSGISGTGEAQLEGAKIFTEPWKPKLGPTGKPDDQWGDVVSVDVHYSYTRADGSTGELTFYLEYLHLISAAFPATDSLGHAIPGVDCEGLGPMMRNGKKLSAEDLANRPLVGFEGATDGPHVHVQARLADGSVGGFLKGPLVDPTVVLWGDH